MNTMTVFANFPDRSDDLRIPFCLDWSVHSGYLTVGTHNGRALLYRYVSCFGYFLIFKSDFCIWHLVRMYVVPNDK